MSWPFSLTRGWPVGLCLVRLGIDESARHSADLPRTEVVDYHFFRSSRKVRLRCVRRSVYVKSGQEDLNLRPHGPEGTTYLRRTRQKTQHFTPFYTPRYSFASACEHFPTCAKNQRNSTESGARAEDSAHATCVQI